MDVKSIIDPHSFLAGTSTAAAWGESASVAEAASLTCAGLAAAFAVEAGEGTVATALADCADSREGDADRDQHGGCCDEDGAAVKTARKFIHSFGLVFLR